MRETLTEVVLTRMGDLLSPEQMSALKGVLYVTLQDFEVKRSCTEVSCEVADLYYYVNLFLARKRAEGKSRRTIEQYKLHLDMMMDGIGKEVGRITESDLFCYLTKYQYDRGVSNQYLDHIRLVMSSFFGWLCRKRYIPYNPAQGLEPIKSERRIKKPLSDEDLERLRLVCKKPRELAMIEFLYSTGMRVSEMAALNIKDIDFASREVVVMGKGSKERITYLNARASLHLRSYLQGRADPDPALFVSKKAPYNRLTVAGIEDILRRLGREAGVDNVHPHRLRRTFATNALKKGMPLEEVKEVMGHIKMDTTLIYCEVSKDNIKSSHNKYMSA